MEVEEAHAYIKAALSKALTNRLGQSPSETTIRDVQNSIRAGLSELMASTVAKLEERDRDATVELFMLQFCMPKEKPDPKAIVEKISSGFLEILVTASGGPWVPGVVNFLWAEHCKRRGTLKDWSWTWGADGEGGTMSMQLKQVVQYSFMEITLGPSESK